MTTGILLSGGIDSSALCFWKRPDIAIALSYGQRAATAELHAATQIAQAVGVHLEVIHADCSAVGLGDMATEPPSADPCSISRPSPEWWPFRNQLLVTLACAFGVRLRLQELMIGTVRGDDRHRDGTPQFVELLTSLMEMQEGGISVTAPAICMTSIELVLASGIPHSVLAWSHSCHRNDFACGQCRGCLKHAAVLGELTGIDRP